MTPYRTKVSQLWITNCRVDSSGMHNIFIGCGDDVRIENNRLSNASTKDPNESGSGIQYNDQKARGLIIRGNTIDRSGGYAVCVVGVEEFFLIGNRIVEGRDPAIRVLGGAKNWVISGNTLTGVHSIGISVSAEPAGQTYNGTISGNVVTGCGMTGIVVSGGENVSITGNTVIDNARWQNAEARSKPFQIEDWCGIALTSMKHVVVTGNRVGNTEGNRTQPHGIVEAFESDENLIFGNDLSGNVLRGCRAVGAHTVVRDNIGADTGTGEATDED
jgi:parallel beta-helix repeat protein